MHIDAREMPDNSIIEGDLCIIGAGAAGLNMALDWLGDSRTVVLLEGGGFDYDDQVQDLYAGSTTGQRYYPLKSCRLHQFGGTMGHWAGFCSDFDAIDFEKRDYVPHSGWPITRRDLQPFYERAHRRLALREFNYDAAYWQQKLGAPMLPLDDSVVRSKMWQFSPYGGAMGMSGGQFGAVHRDAIVGAANIRLHTYANVVDIRANENVSAITEVVVSNHAGKTHRVRARHFVLACCAIQNARLLLAANSQARRGLGNDHDLVGRHFMEHLEISSARLWLDRPDPLQLYSAGGVGTPRAELAIVASHQRQRQMLNGTASLTPVEVAQNMPVAIRDWSSESPLDSSRQFVTKIRNAAAGVDAAAAAAGFRAFELSTRIEQAPDPDSRVTLDTERDALGVPRARLHWKLNDLDKRSIRELYGILGTEIGRAGVGRVQVMEYLRDPDDRSWPDFTGGGWHHMGTTRMSDNPKTGVVDANCRVHGIANLHVAGSSCYATAGAVNPTLTLVALSLRLSDRLKNNV